MSGKAGKREKEREDGEKDRREVDHVSTLPG
jgi:hypothetical protein